MGTLNKEELLNWARKYDEEATELDREIEKELTSKFFKNNLVTKDDLEKINRWKFQEMMPGRLKRQLYLLKRIPEEAIQQKTREAFNATSDTERLHILLSPPKCGIGPAVGSTILTFFDPQNYGVFDIHAWRELFGEVEIDPSDPKSAVQFFERLREISGETRLPCRTVEKALFQKNLEKSRR